MNVLKTRDCFSENCRKPIIPIMCIWSLSGLGKIYIDFCDDFHSMKSWGNFPLSLGLNHIIRYYSLILHYMEIFTTTYIELILFDKCKLIYHYLLFIMIHYSIERFERESWNKYWPCKKMVQFVSFSKSFKMTFRKEIKNRNHFPAKVP